MYSTRREYKAPMSEILHSAKKRLEPTPIKLSATRIQEAREQSNIKVNNLFVMADEELYRKAKDSIKAMLEGQKQIEASIMDINDKANRSEILLGAMVKTLTTVSMQQQQAKDQLSKTFDFYRNGKDSLLELSVAQREAKECIANITFLQNSTSFEMQKMKRCLTGFSPSDTLTEEFHSLETTVFVVDVIQNSIRQDLKDLMTNLNKDLKDIKAEVADTHVFVEHDLPNQLLESFGNKMLAFVSSSEQLRNVRTDSSVQVVEKAGKSLMDDDSLCTGASTISDEESIILSSPIYMEEIVANGGQVDTSASEDRHRDKLAVAKQNAKTLQSIGPDAAIEEECSEESVEQHQPH